MIREEQSCEFLGSLPVIPLSIEQRTDQQPKVVRDSGTKDGESGDHWTPGHMAAVQMKGDVLIYFTWLTKTYGK